MNQKILVLDIDGTLTNSKKEITIPTRDAIWKCMEEGHKVVLASGRPTPGMRRYAKELELKERGGYLLSYNGAKITECATGNILYQQVLPGGIMAGIYAYAKEHNMGLISYQGETVISAFEPDEYVALEARINGLPIQVEENWVEFFNFDVNKCLMTAPGEQAAVYEKELAKIYEAEASIYRSEPFFVEVMPKNVDKAASLDRMLQILGMTKEQAVCCGDGFNDISMIKYGGVGVAMANAQEPVKEAADYITASNDEDGLVEVIHKFILQ